MEPVFIYFNKVKFDNSELKTFTIKFSDGDLLDGVFFRKTYDYYITSMTSSITIETDLKELNDYDDIKKISDVAKAYLKNGIDHYQTFPLISSSIFSELFPYKKLTPNKSKRGLSVVKIDYFDVDANTKSFVYIYSGYEDLKSNGLEFANEDVSLKLNLIKERNELFIEKKVTLLKSETQLLKDALDQANNENVIMTRNGEWYFPIFLPIAKYYFKRKAALPKQKFENEIKTHNFIYRAIFDGFRYNFVITNDKSKISTKFPIWVGPNNFMISNITALYFTPSLYHNLKKKLTFTGRIIIRDKHLQDIKQKLGNNKFDKSVFYIYGARNANTKFEFNIKDFTIPNNNVNIKSTGNLKQDIFNYMSENKPNMSEKIKAPKALVQKLESEELTLLKSLSKKVNIKSLTHAYENFFLYDLENIIKPTFTTELQKEFNIYGLIYFSGDAKENNKLHLIRPKSKLKFQFNKDIYKKEMRFELAKVHKKKTFNVVGDYISNFSILRTRKYGIGQKRKTMELVDEISILGIQNAEFNVLNPIYISITSDAIISKLHLYKNNRFRFVLRSFLFSSNIVNDTDVIIITSNGLSNTKKALIIKNNQPILENTLGVCFLTEIPEWNIVKGASKRIQIVFSDSEDVNRNDNHLAFSFITKNIADLLQFSITLLDGAGKAISFPTDETKLPIINFTIQIIR